jgi:hypothetical protein
VVGPSPHRFGDPDALGKVLTDAGFTEIAISKYVLEYKANSFEEYWSEFFHNGYGNSLSSLVFSKKDLQLSARIKSDVREKIAAQYMKDNELRLPWEVLVAVASSST